MTLTVHRDVFNHTHTHANSSSAKCMHYDTLPIPGCISAGHSQTVALEPSVVPAGPQQLEY